MELVEDFDEKSDNNNNGKSWKSSRILRVKPNFFIFFSFLFFLFFLFFSFFSFFFSFFHVSSFFFIFLFSSFFFIFFISDTGVQKLASDARKTQVEQRRLHAERTDRHLHLTIWPQRPKIPALVHTGQTCALECVRGMGSSDSPPTYQDIMPWSPVPTSSCADVDSIQSSQHLPEDSQ